MTESQRKFKELLASLFKDYEEEMESASNAQIKHFEQNAKNKGVPDSVVKQLVEFYHVINGVPCLNSFDFYACDDETIFEWWDKKQLWLGSKDDDVLRWANGKFCLGDASNVSYSKDSEFNTLEGLIKYSLKEWNF